MFKKGFVKAEVGVVITMVTSLFCMQSSAQIWWDFRMYSSPSYPVVEMNFDAAGYSDWMYWGYNSPRHPYEQHEMLWGEWAAAIYYDGLDNAMWLTDLFSYPDWPTNTNLETVSFSSWDNNNNPIDGLDTAQSVISNNQVRITIDYEMVDLGQQEANGEGGSPMAFGSFQGRPAFVYSERYVLLQTYTITNITANPLTNFEFYQMLHGHPANEKASAVYSVYETAYYSDPLANYVPYNPVHTVGNFRYDITQ